MLNYFVPRKMCQCWQLASRGTDNSIRGSSKCISMAECLKNPQGHWIFNLNKAICLWILWEQEVCVNACVCVAEGDSLSISAHRLSVWSRLCGFNDGVCMWETQLCLCACLSCFVPKPARAPGPLSSSQQAAPLCLPQQFADDLKINNYTFSGAPC